MIAIGSDHGGYKLKEEIKKYLDEKEIQYKDLGCISEERVDYPNIAKEVAKQIAKQNKCPLVLGSATPDLRNYYVAIKENDKEMELLKLTKRANKSSLPKVQIIDLKQELINGNHSMLSIDLYNGIEENLKLKRQTILFLNRRGYSTFIMCRICGYTVT